MSAYFERTAADRYRPTTHAGGAWNDSEIHFSPLGGLIVHAIDRHRTAQADGGQAPLDTQPLDTQPLDKQPLDKQLGRISFDILGFLAADECTISVETIRPGRTIELIEATVTIAGRAPVLARAWFIGAVDTTTVAGGVPAALLGPETLTSWPMNETWTGGYVSSLDVRPLSPPVPGRTTAWLGTGIHLVEGEEVSPHASFITLVDTANGIAVRERPTEWLYPNLDLTIHLYRQPAGRWVGLDTTVTFGPAGHGLTSSVLHDTTGPVGRAEQILTIRPVQQEAGR
ncbi:thioesterase family protein [Subtercola endophyticus]|uniref:thioesterase family protein n=1 Tax=Subtercola endophyticus TaxID=2895559 RepID=UPI001E42E2E0|nr:thioesterase family protein [Subtercola endophyticus]UFS60032.1 thioesterase family protein [Subtercola endophyticus]